MQDWLHKGKIEGVTLSLRHAKVLFCGPSKASFSHLLRNIPHEKTYNSTNVGEALQILVSGKVDIVGTEWTRKSLDFKSEMEKLLQYFVSKLGKNLICRRS